MIDLVEVLQSTDVLVSHENIHTVFIIRVLQGVSVGLFKRFQ